MCQQRHQNTWLKTFGCSVEMLDTVTSTMCRRAANMQAELEYHSGDVAKILAQIINKLEGIQTVNAVNRSPRSFGGEVWRGSSVSSMSVGESATSRSNRRQSAEGQGRIPLCSHLRPSTGHQRDKQ